MPSPKFRKDTWHLSRRQAALLIQLRTGHVPLNKHLHRIGRVVSPKCPACPECDESVHHFLFICPRYAAQRRQLEAQLRRAARSIAVLLANPKAFAHLFKYICDMHRFHDTLGDP